MRARPQTSPCCVVALVLAPAVAAAEVPDPPRLPVSPGHFAREMLPVAPRTGVGLRGGWLKGAAAGVDERRWVVAALGEAALGPVGLLLEVPVVRDEVVTEGLYGAGSAARWAGGDLRLGVRTRLPGFRLGPLPVQTGAGVQATLPAGAPRRLWPRTPVVPAPPHDLPPPRWTVNAAGTLATEWRGLGLQLDLGLSTHVLDEARPPDQAEQFFATVGIAAGYRLLPFLTPLLQADAELELRGQTSLRQLLFLAPAVRLRLVPRLAIDLSVRVPLREEARREQRLSVGLALHLDLGN